MGNNKQEEQKTFQNFDKYGLEPFADKLTTYLQVESRFVEESFVLSLNSEFGSGKSTFFEMWANKLNATKDIFKVVYLNAWISDYQGDPLLAIISGLLDHLGHAEDAEPIKETAGKLCKFTLSIGNDVVKKVTGVDIIKAGEYAEPKSNKEKKKLGHACFELFQEKQELFKELRKRLFDLVQKTKQPILIIVDELDRCRPNHAIEFLETIKHFFDIKGLIFVIGVDKGQLASSAKALFGQELIFDEYYRKFAHRDISMPVKSQAMTETFCRKLAEEYLNPESFKSKGRYSYINQDHYSTENIVLLCKAFSMNARQLHEYFRILAHIFSQTKESTSRLLRGWQIGTCFMTVLSIKNHDIYEKIGKENISLSELTDFFISIKGLFSNKGNYNPLAWAALLYQGIFPKVSLDDLEEEFKKLGVWDSTGDKETFKEEIQRVAEAYGRFRDDTPVLPNIYKKIEELRTFEN